MILGFARKKTIEDLLREAAVAGIATRPGVTVDQICAEWGRKQIETSGIELFLAALGDDQFDPQTFEARAPLTDDVWHFDAEAIEDHGAYVRIVENCRRLSGGELEFDSVTDFVDVENRVAWVEIVRNGVCDRLNLHVHNDWVDEKIFLEMDRRLAASGSQRRLAMHSLGQDCLYVCMTPERVVAVNRALGTHFTKLNF